MCERRGVDELGNRAPARPLRDSGEGINRNLVALGDELAKNVMQLAAPTIRVVSAERGCSAVAACSTLFDLGDTSLDITAAVLGRMEATR